MNAHIAGRRLAVVIATGGLMLTIPAAAFGGTPGSSSPQPPRLPTLLLH